MASSNSAGTIIKTLGVLGVKPLSNLALYRLGLASGHYRRESARQSICPDLSGISAVWPYPVPEPDKILNLLGDDHPDVLERARGILNDRYPLFGGDPAAIDLAPSPPLADWTAYERRLAGRELGDVKFTWESARFSWAVNLAQAFLITGDETFSEKFWDLLEIFTINNPPYLGLNWVSAQECAVRIITSSFALSIFSGEPGFDETRRKMALEFLVLNARRIPLTLPYSRAQNNNHLLLEGAGLFTAGSILEGYAESPRWKSLGWKIINSALKDQIGEDGEYCQHSMNYHRFMLQTALWVNTVMLKNGQQFPPGVQGKLRSATGWYARLIDRDSGKAPNLGSNDGAWLFQLGSVDFADHRPTAQAAYLAFFGEPFLPKGKYDELAEWLVEPAARKGNRLQSFSDLDSFYRIGFENDWAVIRTARYRNRPFQADQLHVDLWEGGQNILLDPGTYSYNAPPPWENSLASAIVHNTATIDGMDQMTRAGRFLWLDWAQAKLITRENDLCEAFHDGYHRIGVRHTRRVHRLQGGLWDV